MVSNLIFNPVALPNMAGSSVAKSYPALYSLLIRINDQRSRDEVSDSTPSSELIII